MSRVILLKESVLSEDPASVLLIPSGWLFDALLDLLGPGFISPKRIMHWEGAPDSRHLFPKLHTIFFRQENPEDLNMRNDWFYIHIPPLSPLQKLRQLLHSGLPKILPLASGETPTGAVLYTSREDTKLRR